MKKIELKPHAIIGFENTIIYGATYFKWYFNTTTDKYFYFFHDNENNILASIMSEHRLTFYYQNIFCYFQETYKKGDKNNEY